MKDLDVQCMVNAAHTWKFMLQYWGLNATYHIGDNAYLFVTNNKYGTTRVLRIPLDRPPYSFDDKVHSVVTDTSSWERDEYDRITISLAEEHPWQRT